MATVVTMKRNDTGPPLVVTLLDATAAAVDLTDATGIRFLMRRKDDVALKVDGTCSVVGDPTDGQVQYEWQEGDTDTSDPRWLAELEVTFDDGVVETFPNDSYLIVKILDDLDVP